MAKKVYWASRHELFEYQKEAMRKLHGRNVEIVCENVNFTGPTGLADYIDQRPDGYVYPTAGGIHYAVAVIRGKEFFIFEANPLDRSQFTSIYHIFSHYGEMYYKKVWERKTKENKNG